MKNNSFNRRFVTLDRQNIVLLILSSFVFLLILIRLIFLQLVNNETYKRMSDENRIRLIASQPIRGRILDRNGNVLASNKIIYSLIVKPQFVGNTNWENYKIQIL